MANKIPRSSFVFVLSLALVVGACQSKKSTPGDSTLVNAYKLIDDQRDDEAIFLLEQELERVPAETAYRQQVKTALASAYAHKAGIRVQKFAAIFKVSKNKIDLKSKPAIDHKKAKSKSEAVDAMMASISSLSASYGLLLNYYTAIPTVSRDKEIYLNYALRVLDSIEQKNLSESAAMYRAALRVIFLKNYLAAHVFDQGNQPQLDIDSCKIDFEKLGKSVATASKMSIQIVDDMAWAQPSQKKGLIRLREQLANTGSDLTSLMTSASLLDEGSRLFANRVIVESGLRSLLKCQATDGSISTSP